MSTVSYDGSDERLEAVLAEYLQSLEEGRPLNREMLLARHPDLAEELRVFFANSDFMHAHTNGLESTVPKSIGDYQLLEEIGSGAFGIVVKARNVKLDKLVAIKLLRGEQWSSPQYVRSFKIEAQKQARLDHPHIVPVNQVGEHEGRHFFEMKLIVGGSLTERLSQCTDAERTTRRHQRWAAELMATIAHAVHHAHQHLIIHRDLKPGNILLDAEGRPHVTDFGLAKQLEDEEHPFDLGQADPQHGHWFGEGRPRADTVVSQKGRIVGTAPYMSPEQADGQDLSTAGDVYSLGIILFEMLTGQVPIRGATPQETMRLIREQTPPPPRSLNPSIDHRLEKICLKCLQRNPQDRYGSALGLSRNLERWLVDEPIIDPADAFPVRCRLWCRRRPALAGLSLTAVVLFLFVTVLAIVTARTRADRLEDEVLRSNVYAAKGVANTLLAQWLQYSDPLVKAAGDPKLRPLLENKDQAGLDRFVQRTAESMNARFHSPGETEGRFRSFRILDHKGKLVAADSDKHKTVGENYKGKRDYFDATMALAERTGTMSVHVSRVFVADSVPEHKFALAVPIRDPEQARSRIFGVITATLTTDPAEHLHDERHKAVLVGREDSSASNRKKTSDSTYLILAHHAYRPGQDPVSINNSKLRAILERPRPPDASELDLPAFKPGDLDSVSDRNYLDPVASNQRWLAGFAPVGNTEMAVIVQQKYEEAIPSDHGMIWSGAAILLGALFVAAIAWFAFQWFARSGEDTPNKH